MGKLAHYIEFKTCFFEILDKRYDFEKNTPWQRKKVKGGLRKHQKLEYEERISRTKEYRDSFKIGTSEKKDAVATASFFSDVPILNESRYSLVLEIRSSYSSF